MKKIFLFATIAMATLSLASCEDESYGHESRVIEYETQFKKAFGDIPEGQNWDFYAQAVKAKDNLTAEQKTQLGTKRFMMEDMGNNKYTGLDFNDLVIDITPTSQGTDVVLQAVGGTLPIRLMVGGQQISVNSEHELHKIFGTFSETAVNVETDGFKRGPLTIHFDDLKISDLSSFSDVTVSTDFSNGDTKTNSFDPTNPNPPVLIAVPVWTKWMKENCNIKDGYSGFFYGDWYNKPTATKNIY